MEPVRPIYTAASTRLDQKDEVVARTYEHIAAGTVRLLDPATTSLRAHRLVENPVTAKQFDQEVVQEIREQPNIRLLSNRAQFQLERVVGNPDFLPVWFLQRGAELRRTVVKVQARSPSGGQMNGTGFLVGPGLLLTNAHVLDWSDLGRETVAAIAPGSTIVFDYEEKFDGSYAESTTFALDPASLLLYSPWNELDYTLVAIRQFSVDGKKDIAGYGYNRLTAELGKIAQGEPIFIIQHPSGQLKQVVLNSNRLVERAEASAFLVYEADTNTGSSGSPVYNRQWEVVALHHSAQFSRNHHGDILNKTGDVWTPEQGSEQIRFEGLNEGIRISKILQHVARILDKYDGGRALQTPEAISAGGVACLRKMLETMQAPSPASLVAPIPVKEKNPIPSAPAKRRFARPD